MYAQFSFRSLPLLSIALFCTLFAVSCRKDQLEDTAPQQAAQTFDLQNIDDRAAAARMLGSAITTDEYEKAAVAGLGKVVVAALQKPTGDIRLASYWIVGNTVTLKSIIDFGNASQIHLAMLSETRAVVGVRAANNVLKVIIFDLNANTGVFTRKGDFTTNYAMANRGLSVARLSSSTFATGIILSSGNMRYTTWSVNIAGTITKRDDEDGGGVNTLDIVALSSGRFVAGIQESAGGRLKSVCFDVNASLTISRRGDYLFNETARRVTTVRMASNQVVVFNLDNTNQLSARSLEISSLGNFIVKDTDDNIRSADNNTILTFVSIDAQSTSSTRLMVSAITADNRHIVVPFSFSSTTAALSTLPGLYRSSDFLTASFVTTAAGKFVTASRLMSNKYRIASFQYQ